MTQNKNYNILFLLHLPPPVHGSSMVGQWIKDSRTINEAFSCQYINLLASKTVAESGQISFSKIIGFVSVWVQLLKALLKQKPNICYFALTTTGAAFYKDVLLVLLIKVFKIKIIYHLHNKGISKASDKRINHWLYQFIFHKSTVILLSQKLYPDISQYVSQKQVQICPNGIPEINPFIQPTNSIKKPNILFLSNLIESKGVLILLEAMAKLQKKGIEFKGTFVGGEGDLSKEKFQNEISKLNLETSVVYKGKKYGLEKETEFQQADIFVFPTYYYNECFPLVLLEAMQYGLPVISTPEGGIPDIVEEGITGYLVPQKNVELLTDRLQKLIENPEMRKQMGTAGRKKYEQQFTLTHFETRLTNILQEIANKPN